MTTPRRRASRPAPAPEPLDKLYNRPGFMLRRAHQIASSLFSDQVGELGATPSQYGVLWMLRSRPNLDQIGLARLMGLDRSTTGLVVQKLESAGFVRRRNDAVDGRRKVLELTKSGAEMLESLADPAQRAHDLVLSAFTPREAEQFLALLGKFLSAFNARIRTPILPEDQALRSSERAPGHPVRKKRRGQALSAG